MKISRKWTVFVILQIILTFLLLVFSFVSLFQLQDGTFIVVITAFLAAITGNVKWFFDADSRITSAAMANGYEPLKEERIRELNEDNR